MEWTQFSDENCPVRRTLDIVGAPWTPLILREAFMGQTRFSDFQRRLGISRALLSKRLSLLVEHGILRLVPYRDGGQRTRSAYRLTPKGRDLFPVITALRCWGERYVLDDDGAPVTVAHEGCGGMVELRLVCDHGHAVDVSSVTALPGPGARPARRRGTGSRG